MLRYVHLSEPKGLVPYSEGSNVGNVGQKCGWVAHIRLAAPKFLIIIYIFLGVGL
jgi:hypothetical protein